MKLSESAVVNYEIVDSLIEEQFTSADQEDIIKELREKLELLGLDPEQAEESSLQKQALERCRRQLKLQVLLNAMETRKKG